MFDVITVGSASADVFVKTQSEIVPHRGHQDVCYALGSKNLITDLHFSTGGGGTNTATAFSRLGLKTGWVGKLGHDFNAKAVLHQLAQDKVVFLGARLDCRQNSGECIQTIPYCREKPSTLFG